MKAFRLNAEGMYFEDVPVPEPRGSEVLLEVAGAGACHSDLLVEYLAKSPKPMWNLPFTLGHEITGRVVALGPGARGVEIGEAVAVYSAWGCSLCAACRSGAENYCERQRDMRGCGIGVDGGMASHAIVADARYLVPLGDLDPIEAAPLADAGITPYHAISRIVPRLHPSSTALIVGVGGLGHMGVQILRALSPCRIIAIDREAEKLDLARRTGADVALLSDDSVREKIREVTGGREVDAVFDFVGSQATIDIARKIVRPDGDVAIVGLGGGALAVSPLTIRHGVRVSIPLYGTFADLRETIALARSGRLRAHVTRYPLDRAPEAYEAMRNHTLEGRAVITPNA